MNDQNTGAIEKHKLLTVWVLESDSEELKSECRKKGKSVSQVVRWLLSDWFARKKDEERDRAELEARCDWLRMKIEALEGSILHLEKYEEMLAGIDRDLEKASDEEQIQEMEPIVEKFLCE